MKEILRAGKSRYFISFIVLLMAVSFAAPAAYADTMSKMQRAEEPAKKAAPEKEPGMVEKTADKTMEGVDKVEGWLDNLYDVTDRGIGKILDQLEKVGKYNQIGRLKKLAKDKLNLTIKPYLKAKMDFTDNVFLEPDTDREDVIWTFTPGMSAAYPFELEGIDGVVGAAYEADFRYFTKYSLQNEQDQSFGAYTNINFSDNFYVKATERLIQQGATAGAYQLDPVNFLDNTTRATAGYHLYDDWTMEASYEYFRRHFNSQIYQQYNYREHKFAARLYHQLTNKLRTYFEVNRGNLEYRHSPQRATLYYETLVGLMGNWYWGLKPNVEIGWHRRNIQNDHDNDLSTVVTTVGFSKKFDNRTEAELAFFRRPVESSFQDEHYYDEKLVYLGVKRLLKPKLRGRANIFFANRDWESLSNVANVIVKRDDDVWGFTLGLDYAARTWMIMSLDYKYERRNSNISAFDYTENRVTVGFTMPL